MNVPKPDTSHNLAEILQILSTNINKASAQVQP